MKWYTRIFEVDVPQGVEVRLLSRAPKLILTERLGKIRIRRIIINDYVIGICHKLAARYKPSP